MVEFDPEDLNAVPLPRPVELIQVGLALLLLVMLLFQGRNDPSPLNLVSPLGGIHNGLGLPGSLIAGFCFDAFGRCAYLFPLWMLFIKGNQAGSISAKFFFGLLEYLILTLLLGLILNLLQSDTGYWVGLWGAGASSELSAYLTPWPPFIILSLQVALNLNRFRLDPALFIALMLAFAFLAKKTFHLKEGVKPLWYQLQYAWARIFEPLIHLSQKNKKKSSPLEDREKNAEKMNEDPLYQALRAYREESKEEEKRKKTPFGQEEA